MFEYDEFIEDGYLWNFSPAERCLFKIQHRNLQVQMFKYQAKLAAMVAEDDPAIFANYVPHPNTSLEIKYTFNRIHLNDPRETELTLNHLDPVAPSKRPYAKIIPWAFEDNTYCHTVVLDGVRSQDGWFSRGFNDEEATTVLDSLADKKLKELTFTHYPLLTDKTYGKIAEMATQPNNRWEHVTLGPVPVSQDVAEAYTKTGKISFRKIASASSVLHKPFLSRLFHRERD